MALIKKSKLTPGTAPSTVGAPPSAARAPVRKGPSNGAAKTVSASVSTRPQDRVSERLAAATEQLASGLSEGAAAAEQLRRSMEQIASGAS
ncbi:hypothetical protein BH11PSE3_BH11PSE3_51080 [soil metagenome]